MRSPCLLTFVAAAVVATVPARFPVAAEGPVEADLVVYGGTSAAIATAVQAVRMGRSVVVVCPNTRLGGLSSGGLGWTDSGDKRVVGGVSREFYRRIKRVYDDPATWVWEESVGYGRYRPDDDAQWTFEPHIAERVFEDLVAEHAIAVHRDRWLDRVAGVEVDGGRIVSIRTLDGAVYRGRMFVDATYEGDLMAAAGVGYTVGREANARYGESLNGVQAPAAKHQFTFDISPYVVPDDPSSGLLPRVRAGSPGANGSGDHRLQAYNYRMCLTRVQENRVPFPKPEGYDPAQYELLLRSLLAGSRHIRGKFDMLPNGKTDTNNHGSFSTDDIGSNYDYPEASYAQREEILAAHRTYQQGYCWFLANDPRVPEDVREWYGAWGLAKDEFVDNGHWPHQIYVREARRMVGDFVVTENHLRGRVPTPRPIGMGSYNMDSHNVQRYVDAEGHVRNEGDIQVSPGGPYPIDYGAILPKREECANLLVVCAVSSSHIAYGSIRMEPVFMILGQSAATAAVLAMERGIAPQDVDYAELRARLLADGQVLARPGVAGIDPATLPGAVVDDAAAELRGAWGTSRVVGPFVGAGYRHDENTGKGAKSLLFRARLPVPGSYELRIAYSPNANRASNVPVVVHHLGGAEEVRVDQRTRPAIGGVWTSLGRFEFGTDAQVEIRTDGTDGYVIADAVQWLR